MLLRQKDLHRYHGNVWASITLAALVLGAGCARNEVPSVSVSGTVRDHTTHASVAGASVTVSQFSEGIPHLLADTDTDAEGGYIVQVPVSPERLTVHVEADGYAAQSAVVTILGETVNRTVHLDMVPVQTAQAFAAVEGAEVNIDVQPVVLLPGNALVTYDGEAYTGQAVVSVAALDPSEDPTVMPGDFRSWDAESQTSAPIESYGAINVALETDNGAPLQLDGVDLAKLSIPLAQRQNPQDAPPTIPLYYWSEEQGYWVDEGEAQLEEVSRATGPMSARWGIFRPGTPMSCTSPFRSAVAC